VASQRRANALPSMITSFEALAAKARGAVSAEVVTAIPMSATQVKGVAAALRQALGKDPEVTTGASTPPCLAASRCGSGLACSMLR